MSAMWVSIVVGFVTLYLTAALQCYVFKSWEI
jgi:hypothetical protein